MCRYEWNVSNAEYTACKNCAYNPKQSSIFFSFVYTFFTNKIKKQKMILSHEPLLAKKKRVFGKNSNLKICWIKNICSPARYPLRHSTHMIRSVWFVCKHCTCYNLSFNVKPFCLHTRFRNLLLSHSVYGTQQKNIKTKNRPSGFEYSTHCHERFEPNTHRFIIFIICAL